MGDSVLVKKVLMRHSGHGLSTTKMALEAVGSHGINMSDS